MGRILRSNGGEGVTVSVPYGPAISAGNVIEFGGIKGFTLMDKGEGTDVPSGNVVAIFPGVIEISVPVSHSANIALTVGQKIYYESTAIDGSFLGPTASGGEQCGVVTEATSLTANEAKDVKMLFWSVALVTA